MRSLQQIKTDFTTVTTTPEPQRTQRLVRLMNELERDYGTFIYNPTQTQLERDDVQLYKAISSARTL